MIFKIKILPIIALVLFSTCTKAQFMQDPSPKNSDLSVTIDYNKQEQTIQNIGTSFCWFAEGIGKNYPVEKRNYIASLLFSKDTLQDGSPKGIGVSSFRFNIGAGSAEQDTASRIRDINHRVECFLSPDGTYDWNKQSGYLWFLKSANSYRVEDLIAFLNSPPVFFNKNGLAHKSVKEESTNLKDDKYEAYADFISTVIKHFDKEKIHFKYLSPVNEPQWDWSDTKQEGSPWNNLEIAAVTKEIDNSFTKQNISTQILVPEAAMLNFLSEGTGKTTNQIESFLNPAQPAYIGNLKHLAPIMAGHSYFTDNGNEQIVQTRKAVRNKLLSYPPFSYWQSEYCLLGEGYKDGIQRPSQMDGAMFLAKIIHNDLTVGNATAWQYWNAIEPARNPDAIALYYIISMMPDKDRNDAEFKPTKSMYALGHYSRFVRPGMTRLAVERNDKLTDMQIASQCMVSSYVDKISKCLVIVAINYTNQPQPLKLNYANFPKSFQVKSLKPYITTSSVSENMKAAKTVYNSNVVLPPRSIVTLVNKLSNVMADPAIPVL